MKRIGRPPIAAHVSQLPACTVPAAVHDAIARQAIRRDQPVAQVVRDALLFYLKTHPEPSPSAQ
jgi:hypothetical protein